MITLDFSIAVSLLVLFSIAAIFIFWLMKRREKDRETSLDERFIWFCSICTYTYVNTKEGSISICPRCGSYNKR